MAGNLENKIRELKISVEDSNLIQSSKTKKNNMSLHSRSLRENRTLDMSGMNKSCSNATINTYEGASSKTPKKMSEGEIPTTKKTPTMLSSSLTLGRRNGQLPQQVNNGTMGGDRFIPNRSQLDVDMAHYKLTTPANEATIEDGQRILNFCKHPQPVAPGGFDNVHSALYRSKTPGTGKKTSNRFIPTSAERVLDAPNILNDYYLNILDWSSRDVMAVALNQQVYLWNASTGSIKEMMEVEGDDMYISSVSFIKEGNYVAIGLSNGCVQLWDVEQTRMLRNMAGHSARVSSLSWNNHILSSGSRSGSIFHHDVRQSQHHVATLTGHTQEVCALKWSPDGQLLASGGNDNVVKIWQMAEGSSDPCLFTLNEHQAAVKGLAWCPWKSKLLASGGGSTDRTLRLWNINTGECISSTDTGSQVSSILWNSEYKEIICGLGYPNFTLGIFKYPNMTKVAELAGHEDRILNLALSPDETTVMSAGADETLRMWKCFETDPKKKKEITRNEPRSLLSTIHMR